MSYVKICQLRLFLPKLGNKLGDAEMGVILNYNAVLSGVLRVPPLRLIQLEINPIHDPKLKTCSFPLFLLRFNYHVFD